MVWSLGFSDPAGWTRFTKALVGKTPRQIPRAPMEFWARMAIEDVYLARRIRIGRDQRERQFMGDDK